METVTIKAHNGIGKTKTLVGEMKVKKPKTFAEAAELGYDEAYVMEHFWDGQAIIFQRQIRTGANGPSQSAEARRLIALIKADPDGELATLAKKVGFTVV